MGADEPEVQETPPLRDVVVIGAGVMGSGLAQTLALAGCNVTCTDLDDEQLARAEELTIRGRYGFDRAVEGGHLAPEAAAAAMARLAFSSDHRVPVAACDLVLEAVPEDVAVKRALFAECDAIAPDRAIFATNTSGLSVAAIGEGTGRADRVIGWHWASPAQLMLLAEIVVTPATSPSTTHLIVELALRCGKHPVVVRDNPATWGHVANRIYAAAVTEALAIVAEGLTDEAGVDQVMVDAFRWPAGPFQMVSGARSGWEGG